MISVRKIKDTVIYQDEGYNTFPSITVDSEGALCVAFRHAPDRRAQNNGHVTHMDWEAQGYLVRSTDGGETFGPPKSIYAQENRSLQDPCITRLSNGNIMVTTFFWQVTDAQKQQMLCDVLPYHYYEFIDSIDGRKAYMDGTYSLISRDNGKSFDGPYLTEKGYACRGQALQLPNGTILSPLYGRKGEYKETRVVIYSSQDGMHWRPYSYVWHDPKDILPMQEPTLFRTKSGKLVCFIRTPKTLHVSSSYDDGLTWDEPVATDIPSNVPYHALQLQSGNVLLTYALREKPFGIRALLLDGECNGIQRSNEIVLRDDAPGGDIGYNSAAQLPNGDVLAIYYYHTDEFDQRRHIAGTWLRED